jgi:hypothetical protein
MEYLIIYALLAAVVGWLASNTRLGFGGGFLLSLLLTPVIGFVIYLFYPDKRAQEAREQQLIREQQKQTELLSNLKTTPQHSIADEIAKLKKQLDDGVITPEEFQRLKTKLIGT